MIVKCNVCEKDYKPMHEGYAHEIGFCVYCERWESATIHDELCMCVGCLG